MTKTKQPKNKRSWPVTIIAGLIAIVTGCIAVMGFGLNAAAITFSVAFGAFAVMAVVIAIIGKAGTLQQLIDAIFYLP